MLNFFVDFCGILFDNVSEAEHGCTAIMGGGGKTTLLHRLGKELSDYYKVLITSLTKSVYHPEDGVIFVNSIPNDDLSRYFKSHNPLHVMDSVIAPGKLAGISEMTLGSLCKQAEVCLFECDGARSLSLKAHTELDPEVPQFATHVIILVGADVVNTCLKEGRVHRPDLFKLIWNFHDDSVMGAEFVTEVVTTRKGYLSKIPHDIKRIYFVNKADSYPDEAQLLAESIRRGSDCPTFYGSLKQNFWIEAQ